MDSLWGEALRTSGVWGFMLLLVLGAQLILPSTGRWNIPPRWMEWMGLILAGALALALLLSIFVEPIVTFLFTMGLI